MGPVAWTGPRADHQRARRVDHHADRLVAGERPAATRASLAPGTNADDANVSGIRIGNDHQLCGLAVRCEEADRGEPPAERVREQQQDADAAEEREDVRVDAESDEVADAGHEEDDEHVADEVGGRPSDEHGRLRHRQRSEPLDQSLAEVVGESDRCADRAERDGLREDAGHQVVDVANAGDGIAPPNT